jgi:pimeloyl-ACP methyl ester carboxylesterase
MKKFTHYVVVLGFLALTGCESEPSENLKASVINNAVDPTTIQQTLAINATSQAVGTATTFSNYDPSTSTVPSAIDILFSGSLDGTLNIPISVNDPQESLKNALNTLDGFSTVVPVTTGFTAAIDPATIGPSQASPTTPQAVRMFEVGLSRLGGAVVAIKNELTYGVDFIGTLSSVDPSNSTLAVVPLKPLKPSTSYYIVITNSLKDTNGDSVGASPAYTAFKGSTPLPDPTSELLRQLVSASEFTVDFALEDLSAVNMIMSWSFTTQSVGDVLNVVRDLVLAGSPATDLSPSTAVVGAFGAGKSTLGAADVFEGTIDLPYYLTVPSVGDPTAPLTESWQAVNAVGGENNLTRLNPLPLSTTIETIPLLVTTPDDINAFPPPWETVIFQHGITRNRTDMLAVADSLAQAGFAVVAIDMPLHGVVDINNQFYQPSNERTFDVDLVTEGGLVAIPSPDAVIDSSGAHFINLSNLVVTRDNLRQSVADLFALTSAVSSIDVDKDTTPDLDADNIYFVGHSLGAIVGTPFVALDSRIKDAVFAMGGGYVSKILDGSAGFAPSIVAGLQAASGGQIDKTGTNGPAARAAYEAFLGVTQTVVDSGDAINYNTAAAMGRGILFFEIVGDGTPGTSDLTVPNTVPDGNDTSDTVPAPLAGTEPTLTLMGLTQVNSNQAGTDLKLSVKFTSGAHSSILTPAADAAVYAEMQTLMASFLASDGNAITVNNAAVIQTPAP